MRAGWRSPRRAPDQLQHRASGRVRERGEDAVGALRRRHQAAARARSSGAAAPPSASPVSSAESGRLSTTRTRVPSSSGSSSISTRLDSWSGSAHQKTRRRGSSTSSTKPVRSLLVDGDREVAAGFELDLGLLAEPALELLGIGERLPRLLGRCRDEDLALGLFHALDRSATNRLLYTATQRLLMSPLIPMVIEQSGPRRAVVRHLLAAARRADHLHRPAARRRARQPRRRPAHAPRVRRSRQGRLRSTSTRRAAR